ncbi:beta-ketoacyl reductase, partial [Streptomyces lacrimifluminis]
DALAHHRHAQGLPAVSLNWGFWEQRSGLTAHLDRTDLHRMTRLGVIAMTSREGLALFDAAVAARQPQLLPMRLDTAVLRKSAEGSDIPALLRGLISTRVRQAVQSVSTGGEPVGTGALRDRLVTMTSPEQARTLEELVVTRVASVLGHASSEAVDPDRAFKELGFDSLTAVELRNRLRTATGLRLPATLVFDHPTPAAIAQYLAARLLPGMGEDSGRAAEPPAYAAPEGAHGADERQALDSIDAMDLDKLIDLALDGNDDAGIGTDA